MPSLSVSAYGKTTSCTVRPNPRRLLCQIAHELFKWFIVNRMMPPMPWKQNMAPLPRSQAAAWKSFALGYALISKS